MLKAVTLDFWGTLVDDRQNTAPLRIAALSRWLGGIAPERISAAYTASWHRFQAAGALGWGLPPAAMLTDTLGALGVTLPPDGYAHVLRRWEESCLDSPPAPVPGAQETLQALRRQGLRIALISDTGISPGSVLRQFLASAGLRSLFDWLTFSNETGVTKRHPQAFWLTLSALGVSPCQAMHVGDSPVADVEGAHAVGMGAALTIEIHDKRMGGQAPDLVLEQLAQLPQALARWER